MKKRIKLIAILFALFLLVSLCSACTATQVSGALDSALELADSLAQESAAAAASPTQSSGGAAELPDEDGSYTGKDELALYIHSYGHLPDNFVTKDEARKAGWEGGSVEDYLPGMCIGGDHFGNREGLLPDAKGRVWTECDVNTLGASSRGAERIVFSNDGLIYYTGDHYESFQLLFDN